MYYVYLLKGIKNNNIYMGYTSNLRRRIAEHLAGKTYTTARMLPVELVYYESYKVKEDATKREKQLKQYGAAYGHLKRRIGECLKSAG